MQSQIPLDPRSKRPRFQRANPFRLAIPVAIAIAGCNDGGDTRNANDSPLGEDPVVWIQNTATPNGFAAFMGFAPDPPTEPFENSRLIELGTMASGDAFNGMVFTYDYEDLTITRWSLSQNGEPVPGDVIGLANQGVPAFWPSGFYSDTRAFIFDLASGAIVEWNPSEMVITTRHEVEATESPNAYVGRAYRSGDRFMMTITDHDREAQRLDSTVEVAIFDPETLGLTYAEDDRIIGGSEAFVAENGDFYALPDRGQTFLSHYFAPNTASPIGGVLRIKAGENEFDPDFYERLDQLVGASAVAQIFPLSDSKWLVESLPEVSAYPPAERATDFFELPVGLGIADLEERSFQPLNGLRNLAGTWTNERRFYIDGILHYAGALFAPLQGVTEVDVEVSEATVDEFRPLFNTSNAWPLVFKRISAGSRRI